METLSNYSWVFFAKFLQMRSKDANELDGSLSFDINA
jgi:hypothetical protein